MIKVSNTKYVTAKRYDIYGTPLIPMGRIDGDKAEFLAFMRRNPERKIWLSREQIM